MARRETEYEEVKIDYLLLTLRIQKNEPAKRASYVCSLVVHVLLALYHAIACGALRGSEGYGDYFLSSTLPNTANLVTQLSFKGKT